MNTDFPLTTCSSCHKIVRVNESYYERFCGYCWLASPNEMRDGVLFALAHDDAAPWLNDHNRLANPESAWREPVNRDAAFEALANS